MEKILISTANPDEQRLAVLTNGVITDYISLMAGREDRKGSIYRGIIDVVEPSLEACFVNIGDSKKAFLQFGEIHDSYLGATADADTSMAERIKPGTPVLVQIVKDARSEKGPVVTTRIDLLSAHMVLIPYGKERNKTIRISRRADDQDLARLEAEKGNMGLPEDMSLIIRSNGVDKAVADLKWELTSYLLPFWQKILEVFKKLDGTALIYEDNNIVNTCMREYFSQRTTEIVCDQESTMEEAKQTIGVIMPAMVERVRSINNEETLFNESLQAQLDSLMARKVELPSGGELVIDITEALIAIDVNSKRARTQKGIENTAQQTNTEAASEIARRLRLCNLSGLIVIDFIDMEEEKNNRALVQHMRSCLRADKAQIAIGDLSRFGMLEMTRQNIGRALHESHAEICAHCQGTGRLPTVASFSRSILDNLREICVSRKNVGSIVLQLPTDPATYLLNEQRDALVELQNDLDVDVIILPDPSLSIPDKRMRIEKGQLLKHSRKPSYQQESNRNLDQESYLAKVNKTNQHTAPAITSFKAEEPSVSQQQAAATANEKSMFARLVKFFSAEEKEEMKPTSKSNNGNRPSRSGQQRSNGGRNRKRSSGSGRNRHRDGNANRDGNNQGSGGDEKRQGQQSRNRNRQRDKDYGGQQNQQRSDRQDRQDTNKSERPQSASPKNDGTTPPASPSSKSADGPKAPPSKPTSAPERASSTPVAAASNPTPSSSAPRSDNGNGNKASKPAPAAVASKEEKKTRDPGNTLRKQAPAGAKPAPTSSSQSSN